MSDAMTLGRRRTVRFAADIDRQIAARAAAENKPVSEIIRASVLAGLQMDGVTAGDWIVSLADEPARPASPARQAFRKKYLARHQ